MQIVSDIDTEEFIDPSGDKLVLLRVPRHRDVVACEEMEADEALESLKDLGVDLQEAMKQAGEASAEERREAREKIRAATKSPKVRRFQLQKVASGLTISGKAFAASAILEQYDLMDPASAAWVDEQVEKVWARATLGDAQREGQAPGAPLSADAVGATQERAQ